MKVCVLQPDYSTTGVDYKNYDPVRDLSPYLPGATVDHVFLNKLTTYRQLKELGKKGYDIFVNLCEGYLEWEVPSIDVIHSFESLNLPHTGPSSKLYDPTKELMKYVAYCEGVPTPQFVLIESIEDAELACKHLSFPLFVKPAKAGDSLGVDENSLVTNKEELLRKIEQILEEFGPLLVEEYIAGREYTVLVAANATNDNSCTVFKPVEYIFPEGRAFKTYALKTSELHPDCNHPCKDKKLERQLRKAAERIFRGFGGVGYARLDFRVNEKGKLFFLEINFTCSVFYKDGYEGSADFILKYDEIGQDGFLRHIIAEGIARHQRKQKKFMVRGNSIAGYGIYARQDIKKGELVFSGEGRSQRMVTRRFVEQTWGEDEKEIFRRYAYPVSNEVFLLWDEDPSGWAPQNHSCKPNTVCNGLNVVALRSIKKGDELTLDYAVFLDEHMESFVCRCEAENCRGLISGTTHNSVTEREKKVRVLK
ncbi:MAG: SET domain-containing protein-lysine N-methyltransferase [Chitinophagaceae bacterium]